MNFDELATISAAHLAKSIDLNHHGTLFAGRMAEWTVETGFLTARAALDCDADSLVCARLHGMDFGRSIPKGSTVVLNGRAAHVGRSSITIQIQAHVLVKGGQALAATSGYATFVHVSEGRATPHGRGVDPPVDTAGRAIWDEVVAERKQRRSKA
jgi:acyl-CoA hydrolase